MAQSVGGYVNANRLQVQMAYRCATVLRGVIEQYILRRLKTAVANQLPDKTEEVLFCRLTDEQRTKYNRFLSSDELDQVLEGKRRSFRAIGILRKICNHPDLLQYHSLHKIDTYGDYSKSGKMKVLHHILPQWKTQGHKALIFSQTQQMLNILETYMRQYQYTYLRMDGNTPVRQRQTLVDRYNNDPRVFLFLLTTRVGGLGVNLVGANRVLLFDPDWNPSVDVSGGGALIIGRMLNDVH
jgi:DNA excision repair protein ERCC-6